MIEFIYTEDGYQVLKSQSHKRTSGVLKKCNSQQTSEERNVRNALHVSLVRVVYVSRYTSVRVPGMFGLKRDFKKFSRGSAPLGRASYTLRIRSTRAFRFYDLLVLVACRPFL